LHEDVAKIRIGHETPNAPKKKAPRTVRLLTMWQESGFGLPEHYNQGLLGSSGLFDQAGSLRF